MELSTISHPTPCIQVQDAYKQYSSDSEVVLNGLNMTVPQHTIYALLGPSGCGKSTLLNCIIGRSRLNSGSIKLRVSQRSSIGFMPQTISLQSTLTAFENILVYGYFYGMEKEQIMTRARELFQFLELPSGDSIINTLSGGQQRRVSLVVALIHDPEILILDEPTVGVDILLTQTIWDYFLRLVSLGKTVIITTHYIEETRKAQKVAIMWKGVLLAEENPQVLMENCRCRGMEETFLFLSQQKEQGNNINKKQANKNLSAFSSPMVHFIDDRKSITMKRLKAIMYKNIVQCARNYLFIIATLIFPMLQMVIYRQAYGSLPEQLHVGVVNDEIAFEKCNYLSYSGCFLDSHTNFYLSCLFMDVMQNMTYELLKYDDAAAAVRAVKKNIVWGAVYFPKNYTRDLTGLATTNMFESDEFVDSAKISAWVDLSSLYTGVFVKSDMINATLMHLSEAFTKCGLDSRSQAIPLKGIKFEEPLNIISDNTVGYMSSVVPAMVVLFSFSLGTMTVSIEGTSEKLEGTIARMQVAGLSILEYILSLFIIHLTLHTIRLTIMFMLTYWVYDYVHRGSLILLYSLIFITGLLGMFFGMITAVASDSATITMLAGNAFNFIITLVSGLLWPIEGQHQILQYTSLLFPTKWTVLAAHGIAVKDLPLTNWIVLRGFGITSFWMLLLALILWVILKYRPNALVNKQD